MLEMICHHKFVWVCSIVLALSIVSLTACDGQKSNPDTISNSNISFSAAVVRIQDALTLKISFHDLHEINLSASDLNMQNIRQYLKESVLKNTTLKMRTIVENGVTTTVEVTIPYAYGYFLTFELEDGNKLWFNCAGEEIWYETDDAIYQASCSADFGAFLGELMEQNSG
jgi:hypothetical protein